MLPLVQAGQFYYLEVFHKEGTGGDHLRLFWKAPNNPTQWTNIPPAQLWSYDCIDSPPPPPTSGNCNIVFNKSNERCTDSGTPYNPNDDYFVFDLTVTGSTTSGRWMVTGQGISETRTVGETVTLGPFFNNSGSTLSFSVRDPQDPNCQKGFTFTPSRICENSYTSASDENNRNSDQGDRDDDGDGVPSSLDCNDNNFYITAVGETCNDNNDKTANGGMATIATKSAA